MPNNPVTKAILNQGAPPEPPDDSMLTRLIELLGLSRGETPLARRLREGKMLDPIELATIRQGLKGRTPQVDPRRVNPAFSPYMSEEAITRGDITLTPERYGLPYSSGDGQWRQVLEPEQSTEDPTNRRTYELLQQILRQQQ